ncbi:MAG TPA: N-acyl homoserine lactonase family protein [Solirubrobacteraceae bacterium]|jgi:glyoxylase-like metal-dependent hydrolase (beta-lactamase superfamily II)|nr:N-acyl homoserine lactonase family protein [Solirubrobacteraceae bacterium]
MGAVAEMRTRGAELPLEGGAAEATVTVRPLLCGELVAPPGWFRRVDGPTGLLKALGIGVPAEQRIRVPIVAFLLEHPSAGLVLVDTGFHRSVAVGPASERARNLGTVGRVMARELRMEPEQTVVAQLGKLGVDARDVGLVVMTHLHFDHASALCDFPHATVLLASKEWDVATGRGAALRGYSRAQLDPRPSYLTIDFARTGTRHGPFERAVDVFGDGSLTLVSTPGHSAGHLSLIARLGNREALLIGDAAYTLGTLRDEERPWRSDDSKAFERSLAELHAWDLEHPGALVVPGHDIAAWEQLEVLYS